jgi:hypothetical protein
MYDGLAALGIKGYQVDLNIFSTDIQISEYVLRQCPDFQFTLNSV